MLRDVHIHIERGPYTKEWIDKFADKAASIGLGEIYLLEHSHRFKEFAPMYSAVCEYSEHQKSWYERKAWLSIGEYKLLIEQMRKQKFPVNIKWGLEICYFPEYEQLISGVLRSFDFDFATGSIHWVDGFGFDHKPEFWQGIDVEHLYERYYQLMLELAGSGLFTGLAHPDSIKCFNHLSKRDLTDAYSALADKLNEHNMYAEQSGGLALNYGFGETGMNTAMLKIFRDKGVEIQLASDAHKPEDTGQNIIIMKSNLNESN